MQNANSSLQQAIKAKDMHKADVAQAVLEAVQKKLKLVKSQVHQRKDLVRHILAKARIPRRNSITKQPMEQYAYTYSRQNHKIKLLLKGSLQYLSLGQTIHAKNLVLDRADVKSNTCETVN